jgi:hypothetical protein
VSEEKREKKREVEHVGTIDEKQKRFVKEDRTERS